MPKASLSVEVRAPVETIWRLLLDKIENPGRYRQGVLEVEMLDRQPGFVVRRLKTTNFEVVERITAFPQSHEVDFVLLEHPFYAGQSKNRITPPFRPGLSATLTFELDWRRKDGRPDTADLTPQMRASLEQTKALAEAEAAGTPA